jgi:hypothetical protein
VDIPEVHFEILLANEDSSVFFGQGDAEDRSFWTSIRRALFDRRAPHNSHAAMRSGNLGISMQQNRKQEDSSHPLRQYRFLQTFLPPNGKSYLASLGLGCRDSWDSYLYKPYVARSWAATSRRKQLPNWRVAQVSGGVIEVSLFGLWGCPRSRRSCETWDATGCTTELGMVRGFEPGPRFAKTRQTWGTPRCRVPHPSRFSKGGIPRTLPSSLGAQRTIGRP